MKKILSLALVVVLGLCLAGCGAAKKNAATTAIKAAEDAYAAVQAELTMYVPDEAKAVEDAIAGAKSSFEQKNFDTALEAVKAVPDKIKELTTLAAAKKDELTKSWTELSGSLPGMVDAIKTKLDALSKVKKLPANMSKEQLEGAKGEFEAVNTMWAEAQTAFTAGNLPEAAGKAQTVQAKVGELMTLLGLKG